MTDKQAKKTLMITFLIIGGVAVLLGIVALLFVYLIHGANAYRGNTRQSKEDQVIEFFLSCLKEPDDVDSVEITYSAGVGGGGPVPFSGRANDTIEYHLLVDDKYKAIIWVDWDDDDFSIWRNDYPGALKR